MKEPLYLVYIWVYYLAKNYANLTNMVYVLEQQNPGIHNP